MSGHSKWHNIRVKKTATDAKRGKIYTRHAKLIEIAAQRGGDPDTNAALRVAIDNAKADNVPNANIDRAIKKGSGESKGDQMEEVLYGAYGPGSTAMLIECLTDNKNRTLANVKMILNKNGGQFAETSSVAWMFERKGTVTAEHASVTPQQKEEIELLLIDAGAQDIEWEDGMVTVLSALSDWVQIRDALKQAGFDIREAGANYVATQHADVADEALRAKLLSLVDKLEEDDDVSVVYVNVR